jgi:hypothetical protein
LETKEFDKNAPKWLLHVALLKMYDDYPLLFVKLQNVTAGWNNVVKRNGSWA